MDNLWNEFQPLSLEEYRLAVSAELRGGTYDEKMFFNIGGTFNFPSYVDATSSEYKPLPGLDTLFLNRELPILGGRLMENWCNVHIDSTLQSANQKALELLQHGVEGIQFVSSQRPTYTEWVQLLQSIDLSSCAVSYSSDGINAVCSKELLEYVEKNSINTYLRIPLYTIFTEEVILIQKYKKIYHSVLELLDDTINPSEAFPLIWIDISITDEYFHEIAGLRALHWALEAIRVSLNATNIPYIRVSSSIKENTVEAKYMISNAAQALSGILGGARGIQVLVPRDASSSAQRIARNVLNILREESYLQAVSDPVAGSYYIEALSRRIAEEAFN